MQYYRIIAGRRGNGEILGDTEPVYRLRQQVWVKGVVRAFRCKQCGGIRPSMVGCVLSACFGGVL